MHSTAMRSGRQTCIAQLCAPAVGTHTSGGIALLPKSLTFMAPVFVFPGPWGQTLQLECLHMLSFHYSLTVRDMFAAVLKVIRICCVP